MLIDVPKPWNDPMANNPLTTLNLLEHDDSHVGVQLVKAQTVIGSGGSLTLRDLQGDEVEADKTLHIAQNGTVVAEGDYGFRLTTAPGNGLYVNYGLRSAEHPWWAKADVSRTWRSLWRNGRYVGKNRW